MCRPRRIIEVRTVTWHEAGKEPVLEQGETIVDIGRVEGYAARWHATIIRTRWVLR